MRLCLDNFRNHEKLEINTEKTGLYRLKGGSGAGKTNIFRGLCWAIGMRVTNATTYGKSSTKVSVDDLFTEEVIRTKGGVNTITGGNLLTYGNDSAKTAVDRIFEDLGMTDKEFMVSSYVMQDTRNSIIAMTPQEQMALIHTLAFKSSNPSEAKELIKDKLESVKDSLDFARGKIRGHTTAVEMADKGIDSLKECLVHPEGPLDVSLAESSRIRIELDELTGGYAELDETIDTFIKQKNDPDRDTVDQERERLKQTETLLEDARKTISDAEKDFARASEGYDAEASDSRISELERQKKALVNDYKKFLEYRKSAALIPELMEKFSHKQQIFIQKCIDIASMPFSRETLVDTSLIIEELLSIDDALGMARGTLEVVDPTDRITFINEELSVLGGKKKEVDGLASTIKTNNMRITNLERSAEASKVKLDRLSYLMPMATVERLLTQRLKVKADMMARERDLKSSLSFHEQIVKDYATNENTRKQISEYQKKIDGLNKVIQDSSDEESKLIKEVENLNTLLILANKAALDSVESVISSINQSAEFWISNMFHGSISATIETSKEVKSTGATSDKINLLVIQNGRQVDFSELSGGEKKRLEIAFCLALSDMYGSPILMLDEPLVSVENETREQCLEMIREIAKRKLVLYSEHNIEDSLFDGVIELD